MLHRTVVQCRFESGSHASFAYQRNPVTADGVRIAPVAQPLDYGAYAFGLIVGIVLTTLARVPWAELPMRFQRFLLSKTHVYQFTLTACACLAILFYL